MKILGHQTEEEYQKDLKRWQGSYTTFNKDILYFLIREKEKENVIGWCGYHTWYTDHDRAEIGYGLYFDEYKKKGYMTEALKEILRFGFEEMNLHRIEAMVAEYNIPSVRLLLNNNFEKEGCLREHYLINGKHEDSWVYSLLKKEWKS